MKNNPLHFLSFFSRHKYLWSLFFFLIMAGFLLQHSFYRTFLLYQEASDIREEIAVYDNEIKAYKTQQQQLNDSLKIIEEIARINLKMKREDEDIYIIETSELSPTNSYFNSNTAIQ